MTPTSLARRSFRSLARLALPAAIAVAAATVSTASLAVTATAVPLADQPLFSTVTVPGNLILALSVEFPTADTAAYFSTTPYSTTTTYLGYFDPAKCYSYTYDTVTAANSYFAPYSLTTTHTCTSSGAHPLWSGNYLNYASMQSLDIFRWVLTGGNRATAGTNSDTPTSTILSKAYHSGQDNGSDAPNKSLASGSLAGATPFTWTGGANTRIWGLGRAMWITSSGTITGSATSTSKTDYVSQNGSGSAGTVFVLYMNVKVCDSSVGIESNCTQYSQGYKPEGLMQQYSKNLRYSAFSYLNDSTISRDGGVMRASMAYIGPQQPVPGSTAIANPATEWNGTTGVMLSNPDPTDATNTSTAATSAAGSAITVSKSGVMNFLNQFGYSSSTYKTYDNVSELYYSAIRYLKNQSNVPQYSSLTGASAATITTWLDGFPVITNWTDPFVYSCQKNFILGIGDVNTHNDGNLPGSSLTSQEPAMEAAVSADSTVNVTTATAMVGKLEGISNLATTYQNGSTNTYYIAGLAYDSHVKDIRSDLAGIQTVNTYWLDVLEYQTYVTNNQYYLATKYGGFTVPSGFDPYATTNGTSTITLDSWHTTTNTQGSANQKQPDNYFTANNPTLMSAGLTSAFRKISAEAAAANSTSFSVPTPNITSTGSTSYAATYDPSSWTGTVTASAATFAADGTLTLGSPLWDARALLSALPTPATSRKIVTCCTTATTSPGLAFTNAALTGASLISRTNYTSFNTVPDVAASSQSIPNYIAYLRGDPTKEVANGGAYRTRSYRLGDIVNSKPVTISTPSFLFYDTYNPGYAAFKAAYASRATVVYAGANDGMLHAFDGSTGGTTSGSELFAYIPSFTYGTSSTASTTGLASLGDPSYTHHYFVDSTPGEFDVNLNKTYGSTVTTPDWHTLLIGGLGKGGNGYYALDVTDPTSWTTEANVASKVLWEFTDSRMGYSYGTPSVVKTKKYGWVVIFTSGYNNADGIGYFFFVNPKTGALLEAVATTSGSTSAPINLAQHSAYVADYTDMTADSVYAGDIQGNVWRVDLTGTTGNYPSPTKIATLTDPLGVAQPVTTRPLIEVASNSTTRYVLVGTGRLLADSDVSSSQVQTFYAIVDGLSTYATFYGATGYPLPTTATFPITRSQLNANQNLLTGIGSSPASSMGWYFDLPLTGTIAQRVNVDPYPDQGIVAFIGNLPNGSVCSPSGTGTIYGVNFATGKTVLQNSTYTAAVASASPISSILTEATILSVSGNLHLYVGGAGVGAMQQANLVPSTASRLLNWRDVPLTN